MLRWLTKRATITALLFQALQWRWGIFGTDRRNSAGSPGRRRRDFEKVRIS
jgi:hypothetical protein